VDHVASVALRVEPVPPMIEQLGFVVQFPCPQLNTMLVEGNVQLSVAVRVPVAVVVTTTS
jgi:hypothetical protein